MRILQINKLYSPWIGGIETAAKGFAEYYNNRGDIQVTNLVCNVRGKRSVEQVGGVTTHRAATWKIKFGMPISIDFFFLFRKLVKSSDLIVLHHPFPFAFVAYWLFGGGKKLVVWYHSDIVRQRLLKIPFEPFQKFGFRNAEQIIVSNNAIIRNSTVLKPYSAKCKVVYFGVDRSKFDLTDEVKREASVLRATIGAPLILSVGRLVSYKGFSYLIDAMQSVPAHLLIVGSGPLEPALRAQIIGSGLAGKVHLCSSVGDLVPYYHASDLFALPSCGNSEVFGIVQIEAMACGKPVINTNLPTGVPEVSVNGQTGITVGIRDSSALASALNYLLSNPAHLKTFSENALAEVQGRFTTETMYASLDKALAPVIEPILALEQQVQTESQTLSLAEI
jgi:glycosyltransferase involved in cell wall biosynthesis